MKKFFVIMTAVLAVTAFGCGGKGGGGGGEKPSNLQFTPEPNLTDPVAAGATVGVFDAEGDVPITWTLVEGAGDDDNARFEITGDELKVKSEPLEAGEYKFRVTASNSRGSDIITDTLTVSPAGSGAGPSNLQFSATPNLEEPVAVGETLGALSANGTALITWTLVLGTGDTDNAKFTISGSELKVVGTPLTADTYSFRVRASNDIDDAEDYFTFTVAAVPEIAGVHIEKRLLNEGKFAAGAVAAELSATGGNPPFTYEFDTSGGKGADNGEFNLDPATGSLTVKSAGLLEDDYDVQIKVTDSRGKTFISDFTITVHESNFVPAAPEDLDFAPAGPFVAPLASGTPVGALSAVSDNGPLTWELVSGADADDNGKFRIDGFTVITTEVLPNGTFKFRAEVTDNSDQKEEAAFTVTVAAPAAPTNLNFAAEAGLVEPVAANDKVGTLSATGTGTLTYSLVAGDGSTDNGSFKIVGTEVQPNAALTAKTYSFRVQVSDDFGGSMSKDFTVTVEAAGGDDDVCPDCGEWSCTETTVFRVKFGERYVKPIAIADTEGALTVTDYNGNPTILAPQRQLESFYAVNEGIKDSRAIANLSFHAPISISDFSGIKVTWHHSFYDGGQRFQSWDAFSVNLSNDDSDILYLNRNYHQVGEANWEFGVNLVDIAPLEYDFVSDNAQEHLDGEHDNYPMPNFGSLPNLNGAIDKLSIDLYNATHAEWIWVTAEEVDWTWEGGAWPIFFPLPYTGPNGYSHADLPVRTGNSSYGEGSVLRITAIEFIE